MVVGLDSVDRLQDSGGNVSHPLLARPLPYRPSASLAGELSLFANTFHGPVSDTDEERNDQ